MFKTPLKKALLLRSSFGTFRHPKAKKDFVWNNNLQWIHKKVKYHQESKIQTGYVKKKKKPKINESLQYWTNNFNPN